MIELEPVPSRGAPEVGGSDPDRDRFVRQDGSKGRTAPFTGHLPGFAVIVHRGRTAGSMYRTSINAFRRDDDYVFVMMDSLDVD